MQCVPMDWGVGVLGERAWLFLAAAHPRDSAMQWVPREVRALASMMAPLCRRAACVGIWSLWYLCSLIHFRSSSLTFSFFIQ